MVRSNVHCFQLISPLDEAKSLPYSLHASSGPKASASLGKYDFAGKKDLVHAYGKRFKRLKVQEKYLENFVKEMRWNS